MKFFISSGDFGVVNASIPFMNTLPHITQSAKNATTPAISPATIQFIGAPLRRVCTTNGLPPLSPLARHPRVRHGPEIQHGVELLSFQQSFLDHQLPHGHVLGDRLLGEL